MVKFRRFFHNGALCVCIDFSILWSLLAVAAVLITHQSWWVVLGIHGLNPYVMAAMVAFFAPRRSKSKHYDYLCMETITVLPCYAFVNPWTFPLHTLHIERPYISYDTRHFSFAIPHQWLPNVFSHLAYQNLLHSAALLRRVAAWTISTLPYGSTWSSSFPGGSPSGRPFILQSHIWVFRAAVNISFSALMANVEKCRHSVQMLYARRTHRCTVFNTSRCS